MNIPIYDLLEDLATTSIVKVDLLATQRRKPTPY